MGSRGYAAAYQHLDTLVQSSFDPPPPPPAAARNGGGGTPVLPSHAGYRPENSSRGTNSPYASTGTSNRNVNSALSQRHYHQHQQPHHTLLVSLGGMQPYHSHHNSPPAPPQHQQYHQQQQQQQLSYGGGYDQHLQQPQQQQPNSKSYGTGGGYASHHAALHRGQGSGSLSPVPVAAMLAGGGGVTMGGFDAAAAAAAAAAALDPHNLPRISSFDELLLLYNTAAGGGGGNAPSASSAAVGGARRSPPAHEPVPGKVPSSGHGHHASQQSQLPSERWLDDMSVEVPGLSTEPLSGRQLMTKVRSSLEHVAQRYLPCVDFLVNCQQELRRGLTATTQQPGAGRGRSRTLTAHQYYTMFVQTLPHRFHQKNQYFMEKQALQDAVHEIQKLVSDAHRVERMGSEAVKNQFLGGMKDGQSWGLRKWMSKHGNALHICTNIECIHQAVHKLDRTSDATRKLAAMLRPLAGDALKRLQSEIPKTYQAHSSAHPYLPFFHRLESALRSMSQYDPDDDDVICIDDSDDDDDEPEPVMSTSSSTPKASTSRKRPAPSKAPPATVPTSPIRKRPVPPPPDPKPPPGAAAKKRPAEEITIDDDDDDDDDDENDAGLNNQNNNNDDDASECSSSSGSDDGSVVEVIQVVNKAATAGNKRQNPQEGNSDCGAAAGWKCPSCSMLAYSSTETCEHCGEVNFLKDLNFFGSVEALLESGEGSSGSLTPPPQQLFQQLLDDVNGSGESRPESPLWPSDGDTKPKAKKQKTQAAGPVPGWPIQLPDPNTVYTSSLLMADTLDRVAALFDEGQQHFIRPPDAPRGQFWDGERYSAALKLFSTLLRRTDASYFIEPIDEDALIRAGNPPFSQVIRHPLCFRDIMAALVQDVEGGDSIVPIGMEGFLPPVGLAAWNMWKGMDLLQAIDLVFLNSLAYGRVVDDSPATQRSSHRAKTNKLRKELWDGISSIVLDHVGNADVERRRRCMPTRRADSSGFVVFKMQQK